MLPTTIRKTNAQALARKGGWDWTSDDAKLIPENLRGNKRELVLAGRECAQVYWMPVLAQGKVHVELLGSGFAGDHVSGTPTFVHKLRVSINSRFRDDQPGIVFVDLGGGFYQGSTITDEFKRAPKEHDFKAFHGDDASIQPGSSGVSVCTRRLCRGCGTD